MTQGKDDCISMDLDNAREKINRVEEALNLFHDYLEATDSGHTDLIHNAQHDLLSALDSVARVKREFPDRQFPMGEDA